MIGRASINCLEFLASKVSINNTAITDVIAERKRNENPRRVVGMKHPNPPGGLYRLQLSFLAGMSGWTKGSSSSFASSVA
jgi:hypothetical protein